MNPKAALHILFDRHTIETAVMRLASEISKEYRNQNPLLVGVLKGSFVFMADLIRHLISHLR